MERRKFLAGGVGVVAMGAAVQGLTARAAAGADGTGPGCGKDLGPLQDVADLTDGVVRLGLPAGWTYRSVSPTGAVMSDGIPAPGRHDGMAAFWGPDGTIRVVRNHEERESAAAGVRPFPGSRSRAYDRNTIGGNTTLDVHPKTRELLGDWLSLNGTSFNCAGGPTPWGTWITCEETVNGPDVGPDFAGNGPDFKRPHGFIYEVDPSQGPHSLKRGRPIKAAGRMAHEACAVDPRTGVLYQTEDQFLGPAGLYRYTVHPNPMRVRRLRDGGVLEMLRVKGATEPTELGGVLTVGTTYDVDWVKIDDPSPTFEPVDGEPIPNDDAIAHVAGQGIAQNAAQFARPEGCWYGGGYIWFSCTRGGATNLTGNPFGEYGDGSGQIWKFDPLCQTLTLVFQSPGPDVLDLPDNLTVSPTGNIVICEDGGDGNFVRCLSHDGVLTNVAENRTDRPNDEFAGICFSPDGRTMFVNIQAAEGLTFIVWREDNALLL